MLEGESPRYRRAAEAAAEIVNLHVDADVAPAVRFSRILFTILAAMDLAAADRQRRHTPSDN